MGVNTFQRSVVHHPPEPREVPAGHDHTPRTEGGLSSVGLSVRTGVVEVSTPSLSGGFYDYSVPSRTRPRLDGFDPRLSGFHRESGRVFGPSVGARLSPESLLLLIRLLSDGESSRTRSRTVGTGQLRQITPGSVTHN